MLKLKTEATTSSHEKVRKGMELKFGDDFEHRCPLPKILKVPIRQLLSEISDINNFIPFLYIVNLNFFLISSHLPFA